MTDPALSKELQAQVRRAFRSKSAIRIQGGNSKYFYGGEVDGEPLNTTGHRGIVHYDPAELVVTVRAGTLLTELESALAAHGQILGCESPHFGKGATVGGMVAAGLSGPRRPFAGAVRDFVLGTKMLNGRGDLLSFGGEVIKNVAGYDVSRLMAGSLGCLGVILEVSLKVLPRPKAEATVKIRANNERVIRLIQELINEGVPISATCFQNESLYLRLSGGPEAVRRAQEQLRGEFIEGSFWQLLNEHRLDFFRSEAPLWRISVSPACGPLDLPGEWLLDWAGAQRWLKTTEPGPAIRGLTQQMGGHATLFRDNKKDQTIFPPLSSGLLRLHENLKKAFDPARILNPGRMYPGL